jgi:site-specific DNA recombinase
VVFQVPQVGGLLDLTGHFLCFLHHLVKLPLREFVDPGESGRTKDRPAFQEMVAFCKAHRREVGYVIVQNLSRFARNHADQSHFLAELYRAGVELVSAYEPQVDQTPAGKLAANIIGAFNQYYSDDLSVRMRDRCRAAVLAGRWPWSAPLGYRNVESKEANIVPDPETEPLILRAFKLMATGHYTRADVLRIITDAGLRTRKGNKLTAQTFYETLSKKVYAGYVELDGQEPVRGLHRPIVSEELFARVQDVLSGRKLASTPKRKHNEAFPLKPFVHCEACGTPLTGGFARSKTGKLYPRYWCRKPGCRAVKLSREALEAQFVELLGRLSPNPETVFEFPKIAARVWAAQQGDAEKNARKLTARLEEQRRLKSELLRAKLRGEVSQPDYEQANAEFAREIADLERQLREIGAVSTTADAFTRFCELSLADLAGLWQRASDGQRRRVQTLLFKTTLTYSPITKSLNPGNSSLFRMLEHMNPKNLRLASPTGFEPVLPP